MPGKRIHIYYSGHVQGVGFRYTTRETASSLGLSGWVKNLPDGRVEVVAEGGKEDIEKFLAGMESGPLGQYIKDKQISWQEPGHEFREFDIAF